MSDRAEKPKKKKDASPHSWWQQLATTLLLFIVLAGAYNYLAVDHVDRADIPISQLAREVKAGEIAAIVVKGEELGITRVDKKEERSKKEVESALFESLGKFGVSPEELGKVAISIDNPSGFSFWAQQILPIALPALIILAFFWYLSRQVRGSAMQAFSFGQSKARMIDPDDEKQKVTFKEVAGLKEAKQELLEIVEFLKSPKKFLDIGARIPKGVLMQGPPGSGKTLLARAVAGEAHVPFFHLSGSEFVEMFVGVGASRVRDLFQMAKKSSPAIIFIDEIDAIGRHRGGGPGFGGSGGNDEREQTLNQILVEMDGFEPNEKLIVLSATNRPDVLDSALTRPGRFDRRVTLDLPDIGEREEILSIHGKKKPFAEDVALRVIAERTPGMSGADLANVMNEASILAAREDRTKVAQFDLVRSVEKVMLGLERKSHILSPEEKNITAYHEMGHALVASILANADPVHKISIISRGRAAGYTLKLPFEEKKMHSRKEFLDDIAVALGGYAAEELVFGDLTTGASNDISVATELARNMVAHFGMSKEIGPIAFEDRGSMWARGGEHSEATALRLDQEVTKIMKEGERRAREVLEQHRPAMDAMAKYLTEVETLEQEDFEKLLLMHGITPKKRKEKAVVLETQDITPHDSISVA